MFYPIPYSEYTLLSGSSQRLLGEEKKVSINNNFTQQTDKKIASFSVTPICVYCTTYELLPDAKKS
jgi:hypothetical protein